MNLFPKPPSFSQLTEGLGTWPNWIKHEFQQRAINVKWFGAKGDGVTDDTVAIQVAINTARDAGGGIVYFPPGVYITGTITIYSKIFLRGAGRGISILKLKDGTNADLIKGYQSDTLWGSNSLGGIEHYGLLDLELDGNRANNTAGSCLAVYGQEPHLHNLAIKNAPEYGIRMEWGPGGGDVYGMEGFISNVKVDTCGKHGFWSKGPHDTIITNLIVIDAGQLANNTYDGILIEGNGNGRFTNCHVWSRSTSLRHRYALNDSSELGGSTFLACDFEGAYSANVYANCDGSVFSDCNYYAAWNGINIIVKKSSIRLTGYVSDPGAGRPACKGVVLGETANDWVSNCYIEINGRGQASGFVDFTNSKGNNVVKVRGYIRSGTAYVGTPNTFDDVDILVGTDTASITLMQKWGDLRTSTTGYNQGRLVLGGYYLWVDTQDKLRIKYGAPTSDTDGVVVGTQT